MTQDTARTAAPASTIFIRALQCAALLFSAASLVTATSYGMARGTDAASSLVWASVGLAAGLVTLSGPRHMLALRGDNTRLAMAAALYVVCLAWMLSGALGSAAGGRQHATNVETTATGTASRAQAGYDRAAAALKALGVTRPAGAIAADVAALNMGDVECPSPKYPTKCGKLSKLQAESANAVEATRLQAVIDTAGAALNAPATKPANADAAAIVRYLAAIGIAVTADRVADVLTLLAVFAVEVGPGLCLALAAGGAPPLASPVRGLTGERSSVQPEAFTNAAPSVHCESVQSVQTTDFLDLARAHERSPRRSRKVLNVAAMNTSPVAVNDPAERLLALVKAQGGDVFAGQRLLAAALDMSTGALNDLLVVVATTGKASVTPTTRGTRIKLAA